MNPALSTFKKFLIYFLIITILFFYTSQTSKASTLSIGVPDKIRVAIAESAEGIELAIKGPYKITTIETGEVLKKGDVLWSGKFSPTRTGIRLKTFRDEDFKIYGINIIPNQSPSIHIGKCLYRGSLQLIKTQQGLLVAVNVLNIEDYVKGVLYHEVSHRWPLEAIKAQAVASRTFAIYQAQQNFNKDYYLNADTTSQMYRGVFAEKFRTNKAVEETKGEILIYRDEVLPAFFHSVCGGETENVSNLWKLSIKPLQGARCLYCKNSPYFSWERTISLDEILDKINKAKGPLGKIKQIKILSRNKSGRVKKLIIKADKSIGISAKEFRNIIGSKVLNSTNFIVSIKNNKAYFKGHGWGHGVGMCQWGAFSMAKKRYNYREILEYYYPGAEMVKLAE